jgi:hypothetical protein
LQLSVITSWSSYSSERNLEGFLLSKLHRFDSLSEVGSFERHLFEAMQIRRVDTIPKPKPKPKPKVEANATAENKTVIGDQTGGEPPSSETEDEQVFEDVTLEDGEDRAEDGGRFGNGEEEAPGFEKREELDENESSGDSGHDEL